MDKRQLLNTPPIIIIGHPRSGTSLLRSVLNVHSQIVIAPECGFAQWLYQSYKDWDINLNAENRTNTFIADLVASRKFETWELSPQKIRNLINSVSPKNYKELIATICSLYAQEQLSLIHI